MEEEKEKVDLEKKSGKKGKKSKKDKKEKEKKKEKNEKKEINKKEKKRKKEKENKEKGKRKPDFEGKLRSVENQEIMVSVTVLTYNHEKYIRQALDSILAQKTNFAFEILIGEDCSTDGTADIVREYERKYPNIIRAFCREKNLGANRNLYELAIQSKGKYVAGLEGDDYWSDSYKLQKQVDFLEVHNEYSACAHNFSYVDGNGNPIEERDIPAYDQDFWLNQKSVFTLDDFNEGKMVAQGSTLLYRNFFLKGIDTTVIYKAHPIVGDVTFMLLILSQGNIYKMPDRMLCYRRISYGSGSSWFGYCSTTRFHFYDVGVKSPYS